MPSLFAIRVLAALVGVAVLVGLGYRVGSGLERAKWLDLERQREAIAQEHQRARNAAALAISTARQKAVSAQRERVRTIYREIRVPVRLECEWNEPERLRLQSAYDSLFPDTASGVRDAMPAASAPGIEPAAVGN